MPERKFDLIVIGAGAAGSTAATTAAEKGKKVALVEQNEMGGTCLNYGCDPTKTLLYTANLLYQARNFKKYGLQAEATSFDWSQVQARVGEVISQMRGGTTSEAGAEMKQKGIEFIKGTACFLSPTLLDINGEQIKAEKVIIATGNKASIPPVDGLEKAGFITNVEAVSLAVLPRRLAIIGGGPIGIEFSQLFQRFGVEVTLLERGPRLLDTEDAELGEALIQLLKEEGIRFETGTEFLGVEKEGEIRRLRIRCGDKSEEELVVDQILVSVGREPCLEALELENAGVKTNKHGIIVDAYLKTSAGNIWAAGDVTGGLQFTHVAYEQGKLAGSNAFSSTPEAFDPPVIPWVTFTEPELAHAGKTEEELKEAGKAYLVGRMPFKEVERGIANGETTGLVKILTTPDGQILGGHVLGVRGGELIAPIVVAMAAGLKASDLANTILPYPTLAEGIRWAAGRLAP